MKELFGVIQALIVLCLIGCSSVDNSNQMINQARTSETERAVDLDRAAKIYLELGLTYLNQGYVERAKAKFNRALELSPNLSEAHGAMGYYYDQVGELDKAERSYQRAIALNPKSGKEHNNYGVFLCRQQQFKNADKEFNLALKDNSYVNTAEVLENAGLCALQNEEKQVAKSYFEKSLQHDPHRPSVILELSWLYWEQGQANLALKYYEQYQKVGSPNERSIRLGIEIAKMEGDRTKESSLRLMLNATSKESNF